MSITLRRYSTPFDLSASFEQANDPVDIVDQSPPWASAGVLPGPPEPRVIRQNRIGAETSPILTLIGRLVIRQEPAVRSPSDQIYRAFKSRRIDDNADRIAVADFADGAARESLRADVP